MHSTPNTLSAAQIKQFQDTGYLVVRAAFARADALAMQDEWWSELAEVHGITRQDPSTWRPIRGDLKRAKLSPLQRKIDTALVHGVIDDLLGRGKWRSPRDWGRPLVTFPQAGEWDVPTGLWHWDSSCGWHRERMNALFVVSFVGSVSAHSGGTLILSGSPRLLLQQEATLTPDERHSEAARRRDLFDRMHPWLMALTGKAPPPSDRVSAFMQQETEIEGVLARVVELTGEPGDMVFCHPLMIHCISSNNGSQPRFMRIKQQLMTHDGESLQRRSLQGRA